MRELSNRPAEHWALIRRVDAANVGLAIFVHGFRGNYLTTWDGLPQLLQAEADDKPDFRDWDYVFVGYRTRDISSYLDIATLICGEWRKASSGQRPYTRAYERLAVFAHSLGTLGVRQALCASRSHPTGMMSALKSITLFGSPLNGSGLAPIASTLYSIADALKPNNPQLRMLRAWSDCAWDQNPWPQVRLVLGQGDWVVGHELSELVQWEGDLPAEKTVLSHSELVKASDWNSQLLDVIADGLR